MGVSLPIRSDPQTRTTTTKKTMPIFSCETSFTSELSSSSSTESRMSRATSVSSELDELLYQSFNMSDKDKMRLYREFSYPPRISASGNYYPRYKVQGDSQTGTSHVSYLSRPYFSYLVPSCYRGYSKNCPKSTQNCEHKED